jgi:hypothetical protein
MKYNVEEIRKSQYNVTNAGRVELNFTLLQLLIEEAPKGSVPTTIVFGRNDYIPTIVDQYIGVGDVLYFISPYEQKHIICPTINCEFDESVGNDILLLDEHNEVIGLIVDIEGGMI